MKIRSHVLQFSVALSVALGLTTAAFAEASAADGWKQGRVERRFGRPKTPDQAPSASVYQSRIKASIRRRMAGLQRCYEAAVRTRPNLGGKLSYTLMVGTDGAVLSIRAGSGSLRNTVVDRCSVAKIKAWRFPMAGASAPVQVSFSAVFTSS